MAETITEDFVSFETAKLLRDKGFDESCEHIYDGDGYLLANDCGNINADPQSEYFCALAPTIQMAVKWFRKVHKIFIVPTMSRNTFLWGYRVLKSDGSTFCLHANTFNECEDACDAGLKNCSENLI